MHPMTFVKSWIRLFTHLLALFVLTAQPDAFAGDVYSPSPFRTIDRPTESIPCCQNPTVEDLH